MLFLLFFLRQLSKKQFHLEAGSAPSRPSTASVPKPESRPLIITTAPAPVVFQVILIPKASCANFCNSKTFHVILLLTTKAHMLIAGSCSSGKHASRFGAATRIGAAASAPICWFLSVLTPKMEYRQDVTNIV